MASSLAMIDKNMNIDDFVDECFQFAVDYQGGKPDGSKKPKGTIRKHQRLVNLKSQLLQSRQQVMKNVLNARALEKSLLQVEMTETVMKKRVMATEEMNRMSATKQALVALQCGKPLAFSDASLEFIEEAAMLPRGVGAALQKGLNCWSDTDIDAGLKNTPFSKSQASLVIDRSLFQRVVIAASGAYLSEIDAGLLYDKGEALYDMLLRRTSQQVSITKWDLLCTMLKKQLLICHLARTLSTGENLLAQQPAFLLKSKSTKLISSSELISDTSRGRASMTGIHSATSTRRPNSNSKQMLSSSLESTYQIKDVKRLRKNNKIVGGKNVPKKNFSKSLTLSRLSSTESVYDDLMNEFSQSLIDKNAISNSMATQMAWVTQEINLGKDFTSARNFAKHIGVRKMEKVIWSKVKRKQGEVLAKWKSVTIYCENKDKCVSFLKTMSTYRISNALQSGIENKLKRGLNRLIECKEWFSYMEIYAALIEIQRVWRGGLARSDARRKRRHRAATKIASAYRRHRARETLAMLRYLAIKEKAANRLIKWWYSLRAKRLMHKIRVLRKQRAMSVQIQRMYRGMRARKYVKSIRLRRKRWKGALRMQCLYRRYKAILFVEFYRHNKLIWDSSIVIQKHVRALLAVIKVAELREKNGCAAIIQHAWLCCMARHRVECRRRHLAAIKIQRTFRGNCGRKLAAWLRHRKTAFNEEKMFALHRICPYILGFNVRLKWVPILKAYMERRNNAAIRIQHILDSFKLRIIANQIVSKIRAKRAVELAKKKEQQRQAIRRDKAVRLIQKHVRGLLGRRKFAIRKKEWQAFHLRYKFAKPVYFRMREDYLREQNTFHRPYVITLQCAWRCYKAKTFVKYWRVYVYSRKIQRAWRLYAGVKEAKQLLAELKLLHAAKLEAIIPMQAVVRMYLAKLLANMHRSGGIVTWFAREVKSRGLVGKALTNFRIRKRAEMKRQNGAIRIQTMVRGVLGRKIFRKAYKQLTRQKAVREKNKNLRAAVKIQCMARRVLAKATVNARRLIVIQQEQQEQELEEIESKLDSMHSDWMQDLMAIRAQTGVRGMLATKDATKLALMRQADIKEKERKYKHKMVSLIQAAVRGMAARALHQKRLPFLRKERQLRRFCVECEVKVAIRRCVQCKDRYCEDCYATIHKKGYRRGHNWEPIGGNVGLNDTEIVVTANNSGGKSMNASGTLGQSRGGTSSNTVGGGLNATSPWQEFFDAGAQAKYWFNTDTGEATWVCPF